MSTLNIPFRCYGENEPVGRHQVPADPAVSDVNITTYRDAVAALTTALPNQVVLKDEVPKDAAVAGPVPPTALRGKKWRVKYQDNVDGSTAYVTIPGADETLLTSGIYLDITAGVGLAFKQAFETVAVSRPQPGTNVGGGNSVTVLSVRLATETS